MGADERHHGDPDVVSLACARFEDSLAEGGPDAAAKEHARSCHRCAELAEDVAELGSLIGEAVGPADEIPKGFTEDVLRRAEIQAGRAFAPPAQSTRSSLKGWAYAVIGFAAAASLAIAFWAGSEHERSANLPRPERVTAASQPTVDGHTRQGVGQVDYEHESQPESLEDLSDSPEPPAPEPVVPKINQMPEPAFDLPSELREAIIREARKGEGCPRHTDEPIQVMVTVTPAGKLMDRTVLSSGEPSAHRCVSLALDRLLLPPQPRATTVTLDLGW